MPNYNTIPNLGGGFGNLAGFTMLPPAGVMPNYNQSATEHGPDYGMGSMLPKPEAADSKMELTPLQMQEMIRRYGYNPKTGQPNTPMVPGAGAAPAGVPVPYSNQVINPNDPNQRYKPVDIIKSPDIAAGENDLMAAFKKGANDSMKGFDEWLGTFKTSLNSAFTKSQAATDPTATISALNTRQTQYDTALGQGVTDYAKLNADAAAREQAIVAQAQGLIPEYDRAAQDAVNQQMGLLQRNVSRYKAASGTPMSLGSAEQELLAKGAADILVPMEQAKIGQRYNVLSQYAMPVAMNIAAREQARIGTFNPAMAQQEFASGQATAQTIFQLQTITSQMARQDAVAFMQAVGVPVQMQQQILSGQISQLGALGQIEESSRYRGLQDVLGTIPSQPQYYSMDTGGYPDNGRYRPAQGPQGDRPGNPQRNPLRGPNAPVEVGGEDNGGWYYDSQLQTWVSPTGMPEDQSVYPSYGNRYAGMGGNRGSQSNSFYDPSTGQTYDRTTGQVTSNDEGYVYNPLMHA